MFCFDTDLLFTLSIFIIFIWDLRRLTDYREINTFKTHLKNPGTEIRNGYNYNFKLKRGLVPYNLSSHSNNLNQLLRMCATVALHGRVPKQVDWGEALSSIHSSLLKSVPLVTPTNSIVRVSHQNNPLPVVCKIYAHSHFFFTRRQAVSEGTEKKTAERGSG